MTKATIRSNLTSFSPDIAAVRAQGLDYVLGSDLSFPSTLYLLLNFINFYSETNSYSCHGAPGVSNTAGAALWTLDYTLFASQIGVSRVHFHEGIGYKYSLVKILDPFVCYALHAEFPVLDSTCNLDTLHFGRFSPAGTSTAPRPTSILCRIDRG